MKQAYGKLGYTPEFIETRKTFEQQQQEQEEANRRENTETRKRYLASLNQKRREKQAADDAAFDADVASDKTAHKRQWLIDHPTFDGDHYEKKVWPLARQEMVAQRQAAEREIVRDSLRATGGYEI